MNNTSIYIANIVQYYKIRIIHFTIRTAQMRTQFQKPCYIYIYNLNNIFLLKNCCKGHWILIWHCFYRNNYDWNFNENNFVLGIIVRLYSYCLYHLYGNIFFLQFHIVFHQVHFFFLLRHSIFVTHSYQIKLFSISLCIENIII